MKPAFCSNQYLQSSCIYKGFINSCWHPDAFLPLLKTASCTSAEYWHLQSKVHCSGTYAGIASFFEKTLNEDWWSDILNNFYKERQHWKQRIYWPTCCSCTYVCTIPRPASNVNFQCDTTLSYTLNIVIRRVEDCSVLHYKCHATHILYYTHYDIPCRLVIPYARIPPPSKMLKLIRETHPRFQWHNNPDIRWH